MGFTRKRIIVADDSQTFVMYIAVILNRMGFHVIPAENGLEVLRLTKIMEPDLILLDVNMSAMDGIKTLNCLKGDKQTSHIPIIMVSVDSNEQVIAKCKSCGCSDYLTKPIKVEKLHEAVQDNIFYPLGWKRNNIRTNYNTKVTVKYDGNEYPLYAETLSPGGVYIRKKDPFPVGAKVEIELPIGDKEQLKLKGNVIYIKGLFGDVFKIPPGMAIEFYEVTESERQTLQNFVKKLLAEDIIECQEETILRLDE